MAYSIGWLVIAIILVVIEAHTLGLVTIWFAAGSAIAFICSLFGLSPIVQFVVFVVSSVLLFALTKPFIKKKLTTNAVATNADRVIGKEAVVMENIDPMDNAGLVKVLGQMWSATTEDESSISQGEKVIVEKIQGVKLIVRKDN